MTGEPSRRPLRPGDVTSFGPRQRAAGEITCDGSRTDAVKLWFGLDSAHRYAYGKAAQSFERRPRGPEAFARA